MKKLLFGLLLFVPFVMAAQPGEVTFRFLNQAGQPADGYKVTFSVAGKTIAADANAAETYSVRVMERDTVTVVIDRFRYEFPAAGTREVVLTLNPKGKAVAVERNGVEMRPARCRVPLYSAQASDNSQYLNLAEYLTGRIAGLIVEGGPGNYQVYLDGLVPLIVVNGTPVLNFNAANGLVDPNDIQSVSVQRDGTIYGTAGMNGVLFINTVQ